MTEGGFILFLQQIFTASVMGEMVVILLARVWIFIFLPILVWLWVYGNHKEKHAVKEAMWSLGLAILLGEIISLLIMRNRPYISVAEVMALIPPPLTSSFPSIHTAASMAMASALGFANKHLGLLGLLLVFGIVLGRMAAGVHFPTDIAGGVLIGGLAFILVRLGHKALRRSKIS